MVKGNIELKKKSSHKDEQWKKRVLFFRYKFGFIDYIIKWLIIDIICVKSIFFGFLLDLFFDEISHTWHMSVCPFVLLSAPLRHSLGLLVVQELLAPATLAGREPYLQASWHLNKIFGCLNGVIHESPLKQEKTHGKRLWHESKLAWYINDK